MDKPPAIVFPIKVNKKSEAEKPKPVIQTAMDIK